MFGNVLKRSSIAAASRVVHLRRHAGTCVTTARSFTVTPVAEASALVIGGNGSLGRAVVNRYVSEGWETTSCDVTENTNANHNVALAANADWKEHVQAMERAIGEQSFDGIICCAGGWAGGSLDSDELFASVELMLQLNLFSALSAARVATKCLADRGLLVLTGAAAAEDGTPGMVAYGISKAATHQIVRSLAVEGTLPPGCTSLGVLPVTIDTVSNRDAMPDADFGAWTKPEEVADKIMAWQTGHRPRSGSLVKVETYGGESTWTVIGQSIMSDMGVPN